MCWPLSLACRLVCWAWLSGLTCLLTGSSPRRGSKEARAAPVRFPGIRHARCGSPSAHREQEPFMAGVMIGGARPAQGLAYGGGDQAGRRSR